MLFKQVHQLDSSPGMAAINPTLQHCTDFQSVGLNNGAKNDKNRYIL